MRADRLLVVLLCAGASAAGAVELDRLFHTPEERERLDRLRRGDPVAQGPAEPPRRREITGYVKRSDGRGTAFIDGVPVPVDRDGAPLLDPGVVRGQGARQSDDLRIERLPPR